MSDQESTDVPDELRPPILYKYQSFDRQRLTSILRDSGVWFGTPLAFNDPFDCSPVVDLSGTDEEFRQLAWSVLKQRPDMSSADKSGFIEEIVGGGHRVGIEQANDAWRMSSERLGILCLTERSDDQLMWGHYASSHSGICFGFDTSAYPFNLALKVGYSDERPTYRVLEREETKKQRMIFSALRSKAAHWEYEREWRVFMPGHIGLIDFDPKALKLVIAGALTSRDDEDWLLAALREREDRVTLLKCRLNSELYRLEAERIPYDG